MWILLLKNVGELIVVLYYPTIDEEGNKSSEEFIRLMNFNCDGQENINITFDSEAASGIICGEQASNKSFRPFTENALASLRNIEIAGEWYLGILNTSLTEDVILNNWSIEFCSQDEITPSELNASIIKVPTQFRLHNHI